ncbi:hypothetical protein ASF83_15200 [Plantibacter sp. Leaf171]|nr:hypothetical protein ASE44_15215 [Plantibacter sp. Leaf1]KQQ50380.1 hypothetical protein ASF68_14860 [Plantibacter sp. Leaf314]KQR57520.1 hypothetical protein ASF83_15200 [Plantibacter sp. Leaf171]
MTMTTKRPTAAELAGEERVLALVDRVIGLEAELARASIYFSPTKDDFDVLEREMQGLRQQLAAVHSTRTWKAGRAVLAPLRILKRGRA